jgi:integrase
MTSQRPKHSLDITGILPLFEANPPSVRPKNGPKPVKASPQKKKRKKRVKSNRQVFTQGWVDRLEATAKRQKFYDLKTKYLLLEVMPTGAKFYRYRRTVEGKDQKQTIGSTEQFTLEQARDAAELLSASLIKGGDFSADREAKRNELSLRELADFYFEQHAEGRVETWVEMQKDFKRWFAPELDLPLSKIDSNRLQIRINMLAKGNHKHRANKALDHVKAILNWGIKSKFCKDNPALLVEKFKTQSRERFVQPDEFEGLIAAINSCGDDRMRDFFLMCLYTGARSGNVMAMRWEEVNFPLGTWYIDKTKNGDSNTLGLSEAALSILKIRAQSKGLNPWVFPGGQPHQPSTTHLQEPKKMWAKILKTANIKNLRIHDLRRSLGSYMAMTGENSATIQKVLGHKSMQAAQIYQRLNNLAAKQATDRAILVMSQMASSCSNIENVG